MPNCFHELNPPYYVNLYTLLLSMLVLTKEKILKNSEENAIETRNKVSLMWIFY